jgi:riboflavin biosynthesis pyrimidine reductase
VEGGAETHRHFLENDCWDEIRRIRSPLMLNEGMSAPVVSVKPDAEINSGKDLVQYFYKERP